MADLPATATGPDRRERYRAFMRQVNPTLSPRTSIEEGLIAEDQGRSVYRKLAARAELRPGSQQLVVGGIGSGKTTELLLAEAELRRDPVAAAIFIDITAETDLTKLTSGALLAGIGLHVAQLVLGNFKKSEVPEAT